MPNDNETIITDNLALQIADYVSRAHSAYRYSSNTPRPSFENLKQRFKLTAQQAEFVEQRYEYADNHFMIDDLYKLLTMPCQLFALAKIWQNHDVKITLGNDFFSLLNKLFLAATNTENFINLFNSFKNFLPFYTKAIKKHWMLSDSLERILLCYDFYMCYQSQTHADNNEKLIEAISTILYILDSFHFEKNHVKAIFKSLETDLSMLLAIYQFIFNNFYRDNYVDGKENLINFYVQTLLNHDINTLPKPKCPSKYDRWHEDVYFLQSIGGLRDCAEIYNEYHDDFYNILFDKVLEIDLTLPSSEYEEKRKNIFLSFEKVQILSKKAEINQLEVKITKKENVIKTLSKNQFTLIGTSPPPVDYSAAAKKGNVVQNDKLILLNDKINKLKQLKSQLTQCKEKLQQLAETHERNQRQRKQQRRDRQQNYNPRFHQGSKHERNGARENRQHERRRAPGGYL